MVDGTGTKNCTVIVSRPPSRVVLILPILVRFTAPSRGFRPSREKYGVPRNAEKVLPKALEIGVFRKRSLRLKTITGACIPTGYGGGGLQGFGEFRTAVCPFSLI